MGGLQNYYYRRGLYDRWVALPITLKTITIYKTCTLRTCTGTLDILGVLLPNMFCYMYKKPRHSGRFVLYKKPRDSLGIFFLLRVQET